MLKQCCYYFIILLLLFVVSMPIAQVRIRDNNVVTFKGSLFNTKLTVKNMGVSSTFDFTGPQKPLPAHAPLINKMDAKRRWVFSVSKGSLFSQNWLEMPADYSLQIHTPFGVFHTNKQTKFYIVVNEELVRIVMQKGRGQFIGAVADQFQADHTGSDTLVNFTFTIPGQNQPDIATLPAIPAASTPPTASEENAILVPSPTVAPSPATPSLVPPQSLPATPGISHIKAVESEWKTGLSVLHYDTTDIAPVGEVFNYVVKITNKSDKAMQGIQVTSNVPSTTMLVIANASGGNIGILPFRVQNNQIEFEKIPVLAPEQTLVFTITLKVKQPGLIQNQIWIKSDSFDSLIQSEETTKNN